MFSLRHWLPQDSLFCNKCGTPVTTVARSAEYKQVNVLFADVIHSMGYRQAVGAERLREIMVNLLDRATEVVSRYGGTVDKDHRRRGRWPSSAPRGPGGPRGAGVPGRA